MNANAATVASSPTTTGRGTEVSRAGCSRRPTVAAAATSSAAVARAQIALLVHDAGLPDDPQ
ncbi:hypothetical protein GCM10009610_11820 [Pseudonocardia xinjiangensis]